MRRFVAFLRRVRPAILRSFSRVIRGGESDAWQRSRRLCAGGRARSSWRLRRLWQRVLHTQCRLGHAGLWTEPGGRVDLRFELIDLN